MTSIIPILSPLEAHLIESIAQVGMVVNKGQVIAVLEAMKMEHELVAPFDGVISTIHCAVGDRVQEGDTLFKVEARAPGNDTAPKNTQVAVTNAAQRGDLARWQTRMAFIEDAQRPQAVAKRHALGLRTARENVADLCDADSFIEYGALAVAAQSLRRSTEDLMRNTPADGMVTGIGHINGQRCVVLAYDATVLAGTQGLRNHQKTDRMLGLALEHQLPVVLFAEGGGGRPGDVDMPIVAGLHVATFARFGRLHGKVPLVGIVAGRCFAGNAALLGCCDVIIATQDSTIGMGGPAMVEGGGLGVYSPEDIGPSAVQHANGVIDIVADNEAQAVQAAKRWLGLTHPTSLAPWTAPPEEALREAVPENRMRAYDTRTVMQGIADFDSLLPLRTGYGVGIHTAWARLQGRAVGIMANNPLHLGGAIDAQATDKAAHFMRLCNQFSLPLISLVDTPGFMVGPATEATGQVRRASRLFIEAAQLKVPFISVVLRKGYGLGAMAMTAGSFHAPLCNLAWPSAEFGAMGLEGAVRLGFKKELEAVAEGAARDALFQTLLAQQYAKGSALEMAATLEIDAVIDPVQTRRYLVRSLGLA